MSVYKQPPGEAGRGLGEAIPPVSAEQIKKAITGYEKAETIQDDKEGRPYTRTPKDVLKDSIQTLESAARQDANNSHVRHHLVKAYNKLGVHGENELEKREAYIQGIQWGREAIGIDATNDNAHFEVGYAHTQLAWMLEGKGDRESQEKYLVCLSGAVKNFDQAIKHNPRDPEYHHNRGYALMKLSHSTGDGEMLDEALASFTKAAKLSPNHTEARYNSAHIHEGKGNTGEAKKLCQEILKINPDHAPANERLSRLK